MSDKAFSITCARSTADLSPSVSLSVLAEFTHAAMKPWEDSLADTRQGISDALNGQPAQGGFVLLAHTQANLDGVLVMLSTGMKGYVPEYLLLFMAVRPAMRRRGIAHALLTTACNTADGDIKLHVEAGNPARTVYEKVGFAARYLDMRIKNGTI